MVHAALRAPPFKQTRLHSEHVGPDFPGWHKQEQFFRVMEPAEQFDCKQSVGGAGFATTNPVVDSIPHVSFPSKIRKKPDSPQSLPHEFWQIQ